MKINPSKNALLWLQSILRERFGHPLILRILNLNEFAIMLPDDPRCITLDMNLDAFAGADSNLPCIEWDSISEGWLSPLGSPLPVPGLATLPTPLVKHTAQGVHIGVDILSMMYWILSREEEVGRTDLDQHGRFLASSSHAFKYDYLERPIVDEWLNFLGQVIQRVWPDLELKPNIFSVKLSHDVDCPSRYGFRNTAGVIRAMAGDVLNRKDFKSMLIAPWIRLRTSNHLHIADPANTFDWIMDTSDRHGLSSAFYFICGGTDPHDGDYEVEHPAIRNLMRHIHQRGHEIGLHPSYGTYKTPSLILEEANRLKKICAEEDIHQYEWGGRMHYLRWEHPTTLCSWAESGLNYDSTLGYPDHPGFRCGTCFEYPAFNPATQEALPLRIRPLIAMDCSVTSPKYMGLGLGDGALNKFMQLKAACQAVKGSYTLLWHNTNLRTIEEKALYETILGS